MQSAEPFPPAATEKDGQPLAIEPMDSPVAQIRSIAQLLLENAGGTHDWEHTLRVHRLCTHIGPKEGADMTVLEAASFLHDIGRPAQDVVQGAVCHAVQGAQMARDILKPLALEQARKENIVHCVRTHRFRDQAPPQTIEAQILFDADKLDAIGAVGVARAYQFAGEVGACLHNPHLNPEDAEPYSKNDTGYREYIVKLSQIKNRMLTPSGKKMALERHGFMAAFFDRFLKEYAGEI